MAKARLERNVLTSFLDRLIDYEPRMAGDPTISYEESVRRFKACVLRDLEWLLNTRRSLPRGVDLSGELESSVLNYGLPDLSSLSSDDPSARLKLTRNVEQTIALFEPRLSGVRAVFQESESDKQELHIIIQATLEMDPSPERIVFDTLIDVSTGRLSVEDREDA